MSLWDGMDNVIKFISGVKLEAAPIRLCDVATETIQPLEGWEMDLLWQKSLQGQKDTCLKREWIF